MTSPNFQTQRSEPSMLRQHASGGPTHCFRDLDARERLERLAIAADACANCDANLSRLWHDLASGRHRVVDAFFAGDRCYLLLTSTPAAAGQALLGRRLAILEAVLGGLLQKNIAIDLELAPSTIALNSRQGLASMGVNCKPSRAHPLLMLAARAARSTLATHATWSSFINVDGRKLSVVGAARPDLQLGMVLPTAELAVIRRLIEGLSYAEIAKERGTSTRTIANQITAVFRRLRVSGRNELVQRLFFDESIARPAPRRVAEMLAPAPATEAGRIWAEARQSA